MGHLTGTFLILIPNQDSCPPTADNGNFLIMNLMADQLDRKEKEVRSPNIQRFVRGFQQC